MFSLHNLQIASDGEVYDGRRDVAHIGAVVDQRADFGRGHPLGRLVLRVNGQTCRIPSPGVPEAIHDDERQQGYEEDPVGMKEADARGVRRGASDDTRGPRQGKGHPFPRAEGLGRHKIESVFYFCSGGVIGCARADGTRVDQSREARHLRRHLNASGRGKNRDLPLIARDVPVELVVARLEVTVVRNDKTEGVFDGVFDVHGPGLVDRAGHPNLDPFVFSLPAFLIFEGLSTLVQDRVHLEIQVEVESLGGLVANGNIAKDPVPGSGEPESDGLSDLNPAAGHDIDLSVELFDHEGLGLARGR